MEQIGRIMRPTDVPDQGLLCDLLWSDPDKDTTGWRENDRGVSFTFGVEIVAKFLRKHDLDLICRAHQVCIYHFREEDIERNIDIITKFRSSIYPGKKLFLRNLQFLVSFQIVQPISQMQFLNLKALSRC
ncbi:hypothetical protein LOD99_12031 [Oopsacas minuta]|uniref:protein-serine/threonine phosphatase n=1 Tax=Oopsacas minuta TaxID=111878 RepID=A0AAV7JHB1_9METZ|nr:hypothetical protein LOD99_12031 [Oopsacas minuta]